MEFLFDYSGQHIACNLNDRLYSVNGRLIGRYLHPQKIFVDVEGYYLGQIPFANRLLYSNVFNYDGIFFGTVENVGDIDNIGDIGRIDGFERMNEYSDIDKVNLK